MQKATEDAELNFKFATMANGTEELAHFSNGGTVGLVSDNFTGPKGAEGEAAADGQAEAKKAEGKKAQVELKAAAEAAAQAQAAGAKAKAEAERRQLARAELQKVVLSLGA